jgi:hypothetical protein
MAKKVVTHMCVQGVITCGLKTANSLTAYRPRVTCKNCLKKLAPVPAIAKPAESDWRWPLNAEKVTEEMEHRRIVLYSYYVGLYRRTLTWHPYSDQLEVRCEDSSWRFHKDHMSQALARYNDPNLYVSDKS